MLYHVNNILMSLIKFYLVYMSVVQYWNIIIFGGVCRLELLWASGLHQLCVCSDVLSLARRLSKQSQEIAGHTDTREQTREGSTYFWRRKSAVSSDIFQSFSSMENIFFYLILATDLVILTSKVHQSTFLQWIILIYFRLIYIYFFFWKSIQVKHILYKKLIQRWSSELINLTSWGRLFFRMSFVRKHFYNRMSRKLLNVIYYTGQHRFLFIMKKFLLKDFIVSILRWRSLEQFTVKTSNLSYRLGLLLLFISI